MDQAARSLLDGFAREVEHAAQDHSQIDMHVPPALALTVAEQAMALGYHVTIWGRPRSGTPSGRVTLDWSGTPPAGIERRPEGRWWRWKEYWRKSLP